MQQAEIAGQGSGDPGAVMTGPMWMPVQPPTLERVLAWHPQPLPVLPWLVLIMLLLYGGGVVILHGRGVRWPLARILWWFLGLATTLFVTATGVEGYGMELFSIHMLQHMVLNMLVPVLLVDELDSRQSSWSWTPWSAINPPFAATPSSPRRYFSFVNWGSTPSSPARSSTWQTRNTYTHHLFGSE